MKKVLLATTALVLTAGVAAAEVSVGGSGRMGIANNGISGSKTAFSARIRIAFSASGETDGGLAFGGSIRADNSGAGNSALTAGSLFISGAFGKLSMGDVDGAAEQAIGDVSGTGYEDKYVADNNETEYLTANNDPTALYSYSAGDLAFYLSAGNPSATNQEWAAGIHYSMNNFGVGLGYENDGTNHATYVSASASFGDATIKATYGTSDLTADTLTYGMSNQYGVSFDYGMGATTLTAYWRQDTFGMRNESLGVAYDLGGGAVVKVAATAGDSYDNTAYNAGIDFSF